MFAPLRHDPFAVSPLRLHFHVPRSRVDVSPPSDGGGRARVRFGDDAVVPALVADVSPPVLAVPALRGTDARFDLRRFTEVVEALTRLTRAHGITTLVLPRTAVGFLDAAQVETMFRAAFPPEAGVALEFVDSPAD